MDYKFPPINILNMSDTKSEDKETLDMNAKIIKNTLLGFKILVDVQDVSVNSRIIRYEIKPKYGIRIKRIMNLSEDIALNLGVESVRIIAVAEKQTLGVEVPRIRKEKLNLGSIVRSDCFENNNVNLPFVVGESIDGQIIVDDITNLVHLLIAGTTGSGKSTFLNSLIVSMLYKLSPSDIQFIMIDPKKVELLPYEDLPHLLSPIITDSKQAMKILNWLVIEMYRRYDLLLLKEVRNIKDYNNIADDKMSRIVVIIDEFSNLMMDAQEGFESIILKLAQTARAVGIHLILCTQRPSVDIISGIIKSNIPSRVAFATASPTDSRIILDSKDASNLLGFGDLLYHPINELNPIRAQGSYISDEEIKNVVNFIKANNDEVIYNEEIMKLLNGNHTEEKEYVNKTYYIYGRLMTKEEIKEAYWTIVNGKYVPVYRNMIITVK